MILGVTTKNQLAVWQGQKFWTRWVSHDCGFLQSLWNTKFVKETQAVQKVERLSWIMWWEAEKGKRVQPCVGSMVASQEVGGKAQSWQRKKDFSKKWLKLVGKWQVRVTFKVAGSAAELTNGFIIFLACQFNWFQWFNPHFCLTFSVIHPSLLPHFFVSVMHLDWSLCCLMWPDFGSSSAPSRLPVCDCNGHWFLCSLAAICDAHTKKNWLTIFLWVARQIKVTAILLAAHQLEAPCRACWQGCVSLSCFEHQDIKKLHNQWVSTSHSGDTDSELGKHDKKVWCGCPLMCLDLDSQTICCMCG